MKKYKIYEFEMTLTEMQQCYTEITGLDNVNDFSEEELYNYLIDALKEEE